MVTDKMDELLYREEMMWLQRSRISWLREGDRNTNFFHRQAVWRARKNKIRKLRREDGTWCDQPAAMQEMVTDYFRQLYEAELFIALGEILNLMQNKVTTEMNEELCRPFTEAEISDALFQMGPLKAPGPDGFPARFFQKHWDIMKSDVLLAVQRFFQDGGLPLGINDTAIVLIPKGANPKELMDFRTISLCNVIYKVISKCLINRLRPFLDTIIAPEQSAFVPSRKITDNALIAFESVHAIQKGAAAQGEFCA
jgi:hypothetical protein